MKRSLRFYILLVLFSLHFIKIKAQDSLPPGIIYLNEPNINFENLISQFKGKIIYLDIWATWCVPCRKELELEKDVKAFAEFAKKNNTIILYVCCDKNGNTWKQFIKANKLNGYHLLVNQPINEAFHTTFSVPKGSHGKYKLQRTFFIPRHMIIDQLGAVRDSAAERQGSASVYLKIKELLNK